MLTVVTSIAGYTTPFPQKRNKLTKKMRKSDEMKWVECEQPQY